MRANRGNEDVDLRPPHPDAPVPPWSPEEVVLDASRLPEEEFVRFLSALCADPPRPSTKRTGARQRSGLPVREKFAPGQMDKELQRNAL